MEKKGTVELKKQGKKVTKMSLKSKDNDPSNVDRSDDEPNIEDDLIEELSKELSDDLPIYISIDKDVLDPDQLMTNWDQGTMKSETLIKIVKRLLESKRILGIDICGEVSFDTDCDQDAEISRNNGFNRELLNVIISYS